MDLPRKMVDPPREMVDPPREMVDPPREMVDPPREWWILQGTYCKTRMARGTVKSLDEKRNAGL